MKKFDPKTEMIMGIVLADVIADCTSTHILSTFAPLSHIYHIDFEDDDPSEWCRSPVTTQSFFERVGICDYANLITTVDRAFDCFKKELKGEGTLCSIRTRRGRQEIPEPAALVLFVFPLNVSTQNIPLPVLPFGDKSKPEPLPDLLGMLNTKLEKI